MSLRFKILMYPFLITKKPPKTSPRVFRFKILMYPFLITKKPPKTSPRVFRFKILMYLQCREKKTREIAHFNLSAHTNRSPSLSLKVDFPMLIYLSTKILFQLQFSFLFSLSEIPIPTAIRCMCWTFYFCVCVAHTKTNRCSPLMAELWGVKIENLKRLVVELVSLLCDQIKTTNLDPLVREINQEKHVSVRHIFWNSNTCATIRNMYQITRR
ncbi:hypothetical protein Syun_025025 [Stephania yunnanensis]|uniref:Uncharacterized protein n=1 Tax=Stephania yunnanensis TaxID=152371 RepID=A0AAP0HVV0_9MAGN